MYFVLQSLVNRNSHSQAQMYQTVQMWKKAVKKRMGWEEYMLKCEVGN